ncbi:MAG: DUF2058 family protein [Ectothiorhodospiraceae bacterium]|nr:DUF2058 family protein [Ectothiorhodospiraceae bacterium]
MADRARLGRIARDARLNRYTPEALARRERRRQLEALLAEHKRNDDKADIPHHFLRGKKVKHVYVTAEQHAELTAGSLSVLAHDGYHYLLAPEIAERAHALAPDAFLFRNDPGGAPRSAEAVDDVPDDIVW